LIILIILVPVLTINLTLIIIKTSSLSSWVGWSWSCEELGAIEITEEDGGAPSYSWRSLSCSSVGALVASSGEACWAYVDEGSTWVEHSSSWSATRCPSMGRKNPTPILLRDFYFCALRSLVVLSFPQLVSFYSVFPKPLSETLRRSSDERIPI
jgi:hypothetical protein